MAHRLRCGATVEVIRYLHVRGLRVAVVHHRQVLVEADAGIPLGEIECSTQSLGRHHVMPTGAATEAEIHRAFRDKWIRSTQVSGKVLIRTEVRVDQNRRPALRR